MTHKPRAIVAMRWPLGLEAVCTTVDSQVEVVATAQDVDSAVAAMGAVEADVVVTGIDIAGGGGCSLCATVKADERWAGSVRVLVVGPTSDQNLVDAVHAGADGYVAEEDGVDGLLDALARTRRGEASIPGAMLGGLLRTLIRDRREEDRAIERFSRLSHREREVLALLVAGHDNAGIAEEMTVSTNTARTHVQNIFRKLEVGSRLEAASLVNTFDLLGRFPSGHQEGS